MNHSSLTRRHFLRSAAAASTLSLTASSKVLGANDEIVLGMIGTGGRGKRLLQAITNIEGYRVAAVCDLVPERASQAAEICEQYTPKVREYTDFRQMLDREKLDACFVVTEEANHAKCVIPVLEAGLHCFSEKPIDVTVEKVDQVVKAARKAKGIYQVGYQRRYLKGFQDAIADIQSGNLGAVTFMQGEWHWTYGTGGRYLDMDFAGCWFLAQACHHADVMAWVMGNKPPVECAAMGAITQHNENPPTHCAEDHSSLIFRFEPNVNFTYTHLMNCCEQFTGEKLWVHTEKGGIDLPGGMLYARPGMGDNRKYAEQSLDWDNGTYDELEAFGRHIRNGEQPLSNAETARVGTLMGILGGMAMYNRDARHFHLGLANWSNLNTASNS
ncbi:MAG: Gfo/Idh/MocA family oxidoreductase [Candidatus Omnitrophica bacterium]|nr:Gfo/Idh/MocA family oxidoreductase [Candidatus Omnitrophota bacterium]